MGTHIPFTGRRSRFCLLNCEFNFFSVREDIFKDGRLVNRNHCQIVNNSEGEQSANTTSPGVPDRTVSREPHPDAKPTRVASALTVLSKMFFFFAGSIASTYITGKERARQLTG